MLINISFSEHNALATFHVELNKTNGNGKPFSKECEHPNIGSVQLR